MLCVPHLRQRLPMCGRPLLNQSQRLAGKVSFQHLKRLNVNEAEVLAIDHVDVGRIVFFAEEVHFYDHAVKPCDNWHSVHLLVTAIVSRYRDNVKGFYKKQVNQLPVEVRIFDPPTVEAPAFRRVGIAQAATGVTTVERLYRPGYFTIEIPREARHADKLEIGRLVLVDGRFWGIIDDLSLSADAAGEVRSISGRQLKGLTEDRITIPPQFTAVSGAQGYDAVKGATETIMKHFVSANLAAPALDARRVCGLEVAPDLGRGVAEDKYMSRHEGLADVLAALGEAAGLGYDITPDLARHRFLFDVVQGEDHTAQQSDRIRVIFDVGRKTALAQQYQHNTSDSRNLFYATMAGSEFADEALTVTYVRAGEEEPVGIRRRPPFKNAEWNWKYRHPQH